MSLILHRNIIYGTRGSFILDNNSSVVDSYYNPIDFIISSNYAGQIYNDNIQNIIVNNGISCYIFNNCFIDNFSAINTNINIHDNINIKSCYVSNCSCFCSSSIINNMTIQSCSNVNVVYVDLDSVIIDNSNVNVSNCDINNVNLNSSSVLIVNNTLNEYTTQQALNFYEQNNNELQFYEINISSAFIGSTCSFYTQGKNKNIINSGFINLQHFSQLQNINNNGVISAGYYMNGKDIVLNESSILNAGQYSTLNNVIIKSNAKLYCDSNSYLYNVYMQDGSIINDYVYVTSNVQQITNGLLSNNINITYGVNNNSSSFQYYNSTNELLYNIKGKYTQFNGAIEFSSRVKVVN